MLARPLTVDYDLNGCLLIYPHLGQGVLCSGAPEVPICVLIDKGSENNWQPAREREEGETKWRRADIRHFGPLVHPTDTKTIVVLRVLR